jgi:hypothetical protein
LRILSLLLFAFAAPACFGATVIISFTALPTDIQSESYTNVNPSYNGYSTATINGVTNQQVICDDTYVDTYMPSGPFIYDYSTIGGSGWASTVAFETNETITNNSGMTIDGLANNGTLTLTETQAYETAAVLLVTLSKISNPSANTITDFQYALWNLFNPNVKTNANQITDQLNAADIVTSSLAANIATTAADSAELRIYTAVPVNSNQEFLGLNTPTPEPGSWVMIAGLGLCLLGLKRRAA